MENASKALLIAGAILLCILIIAIGMFIYNSAQSTITDSLTSLSTQEVEAFNNQFTSYEGIQTGSNVRALMGRLIANADTYADEPAKIPAIKINQVTAKDTAGKEDKVETASETQTYIDTCGAIRNKVETKHEYYIEINYQKNGLIDVVTISYETGEDDREPAVHRDQIKAGGSTTGGNSGGTGNGS